LPKPSQRASENSIWLRAAIPQKLRETRRNGGSRADITITKFVIGTEALPISADQRLLSRIN
jgi:hypothetical protein